MNPNHRGRPVPAAIVMSLGTAGLFEAVTVLATQDRAVRAASPWQDDPYDAVVSLAQFTVPMLALVIALRLPAWRSPGGPDRLQQTMRAAGAMAALIGLAAGFEWASVIAGAHASSWGRWTSVLIAGLVAASAFTVVVVALLVRGRRPLGSAARWRHDWLGDVLLICRRFPVLRRVASLRAAGWVRRHAMAVFTVVSMAAAAVIAGALAAGEGWTDPVLIGWAVGVTATSNLAFCVISNAIAGFIARPPRTPRRRVVETSAIAGCLAIQVAAAFRDALWRAISGRSLTSVAALVGLTLGAGLLTAAVTAGFMLARTSRTALPPRLPQAR
jgi:hypothetical protein